MDVLDQLICPNLLNSTRVSCKNSTFETYDVDGIEYVKSEESRGTSLSDIDGLFGHKSWDYIVIPKGTTIPNELIITKDHYIPRKKSWHYSISPNFDMPVSNFLNALDKLAFNAKIRIKVQSHG